MIILPMQNKRDMDEVPKEPFKDIQFVFVENVRQVFREALKERILPPTSAGTRPARVPQAASSRSL
jgi:ATP-dependent Lon protease